MQRCHQHARVPNCQFVCKKKKKKKKKKLKCFRYKNFTKKNVLEEEAKKIVTKKKKNMPCNTLFLFCKIQCIHTTHIHIYTHTFILIKPALNYVESSGYPKKKSRKKSEMKRKKMCNMNYIKA